MGDKTIFEYGETDRKHRGDGISAKRSGSSDGSQSVWLTDYRIVGLLKQKCERFLTLPGFAPNPFWGYCTLANCKPKIRLTAEVGDCIVGLSPKSKGNRVVFAMEVDEILDYASYFRDPRFSVKIPDYSRGEVVWKAGDNIYKPLPDGSFQQLRSMHSHGDQENAKTKARDLGGVNVLIARQFHYFGASGPELPPCLEDLKVGRGHKNKFSRKTIDDFRKFISSYPQGASAPPTQWPANDVSWEQTT